MIADDFILIALGGAACQLATAIHAHNRGGLRTLLLDTDDTTANQFEPTDGLNIQLFGTARLSGKPTGGDIALAKSAFNDNAPEIATFLNSVTTAIVLTCTGGGTAGAMPEILELLQARGIATLTIATTPFAFEGSSRQTASRAIIPIIEEMSEAISIIPLDSLCPAIDQDQTITATFVRVAQILCDHVNSLWKLIAKPAFLAFDLVKFNKLISSFTGAKMRFASTLASGDTRAIDATEALLHHPLFIDKNQNLLTTATYVLVGIRATDSLKLSEIANVMACLRSQCNATCEIDLGTSIDPDLGDDLALSVIALVNPNAPQPDLLDDAKPSTKPKRPSKGKHKIGLSMDIFADADKTYHNGVNLDTPTYERRNIRLRR